MTTFPTFAKSILEPGIPLISSVIEKYKVCKVCGGANVFVFNKLKELKKPRGITNNFIVKDDKLLITEEGPYKIWISDEVLDMKENTYSIDAVNGYVFDKLTINMMLVCDDSSHKEKPQSPYKFRGMDDGDSEPSESGIHSGSHYEAAFAITINQPTKEVVECKILREILDNGDFVIQKNIVSNSTTVRRKIKTVRLPFVYDKDFTDFDFNKLLTISNLLK